MIDIGLKRLTHGEGLPLPSYASGGAAGLDVVAAEDVKNVAQAKRATKGCDWIVANDVSGNVMGGDRNRVHLITEAGIERWAEGEKSEVARHLADRIAAELGGKDANGPPAPDSAGEAG